jgi:hypothetical protein
MAKLYILCPDLDCDMNRPSLFGARIAKLCAAPDQRLASPNEAAHGKQYEILN